MTESENFVDVVVLSWNRAESTVATLQNILEQRNVRLIIWIVDQGSDPNELDKVKNFIKDKTQIHLLENGKNIGVAAGRNLGIRQGNAEFIVCIDNDAVFASHFAIAIALFRFAQSDNIAAIGFKINLFNTNQLDHTSWAYPKSQKKFKDTEFLTTRFCGAGHALRRSCLEKTDYYDEILFFYWEELDLSYQLINMGYKIIYYPTVVVQHKIDPEKKVTWSGKRFYYLVRNAVYLNWKYHRSITALIPVALGYLVKGIRNGLMKSAWQGVVDACDMLSNSEDLIKYKMSKAGQQYIHDNDTKYRGSLIKRFFSEALGKLPKG